MVQKKKHSYKRKNDTTLNMSVYLYITIQKRWRTKYPSQLWSALIFYLMSNIKQNVNNTVLYNGKLIFFLGLTTLH